MARLPMTKDRIPACTFAMRYVGGARHDMLACMHATFSVRVVVVVNVSRVPYRVLRACPTQRVDATRRPDEIASRSAFTQR